jgi:hypothetical protein
VWKGRLGEDIVGEGREAAGGGVEPGADRWPPGGDKRLPFLRLGLPCGVALTSLPLVALAHFMARARLVSVR